LEERGVCPLFGHVFLPIDLSPLQLIEDPAAYCYADEEDEDQLEEDEEKRKAKEKNDISMEIPTTTEVIVQVRDKIHTRSINDNPILHGKGALFSKLGVEPTDWTLKESVRVIRRWTYRGSPIRVFAREREPRSTLPPPHVKEVCYEVSRKEERDWQLGEPWKALTAEELEGLREQERGKGVLHAGYHGSEMAFCVDSEEFEQYPDCFSFSMGTLEDGDDGPAYRLIPSFFGLAAERYLNSLSLSFALTSYISRFYEATTYQYPFRECKDIGELRERVREMLLKVGMLQQDKDLF